MSDDAFSLIALAAYLVGMLVSMLTYRPQPRMEDAFEGSLALLQAATSRPATVAR